ncbi:flagellar protein FlgN [Pseudogulbenkiania sp. MAI-1]|uniref:flagellar protein FlgN n=1 Tax=Pseudogulbenkiania sp. MAI-1 TaxID=990370 RepID=UPI00045EAD24|nr:flagellar protein FlgN [Pseudogulbenkiania sp. MAI-1]
MSREASFRQLLGDMRSDLADYQQLETLLEQQFRGALSHDAANLADTGEQILTLAGRLDARRLTRVELAARLLGRERRLSIEEVLAQLPTAPRQACEALWATLRERVAHCKTLNERNGRLLTAQHDSMERVLFGEKDIYVPL